MELCDVILRTNRVRCALNMEIFDLLNEEDVSGARSSRAVVELVYKSDEKSFCECLKGESIAKVRFRYFFCPQTYIWTPAPITLPRSRCACGVISILGSIS